MSNVPWINFNTIPGLNPPVMINFHPYNTDTIIDILTHEYQGSDEDRQLYKYFSNIIVDVFQGASRDVTELKYIIDFLFDEYMEPVRSGKSKL